MTRQLSDQVRTTTELQQQQSAAATNEAAAKGLPADTIMSASEHQSRNSAPGNDIVNINLTIQNVSNEYTKGKSTAQVYAEAFKNAEYDEKKGLVVFQRYCHLYRKGELEDVASHVPGLSILEGGFESGNYYIIFKVEK